MELPERLGFDINIVSLNLIECPENSFGKDCSGKCSCSDNGRCDPVSGQCHCDLGWMGETCEQLCPSGSFGPDCVHSCVCQNNGSCDPVSGCCSCLPGFYGQSCEFSKPKYVKNSVFLNEIN